MFSKLLSKFKPNEDVVFDVLPEHVAIVMDGNGRWAKRKGMPRLVGHRAGAVNLKKVVRIFKDFGVKFMTVYAFSTENWTRPKSEVTGLMKLLLEYLRNAEEELGGDNVKISVIGDRTRLSDELQKEIKRVESLTQNNNGINLIIALNYGGRNEIVESVNKIIDDIQKGDFSDKKVTEKDITERLYTHNIPDPDLVIRTSGEHRLSNYLLWQSAYAELWFTKVYWPDFGRNEIIEALSEYKNRKRRFGGV